MEIKLYNALTRKKELFEPTDPDVTKVYACGPTVYNTASIGNFRTFLFTDLLVRTLEYDRQSVRFVMNITDVGHLVSDGDDGEDKLEVGSARDGRTAWEVAEAYTSQFLLDADRLNLRKPDESPKATDHIEEQIAMVQELEKKGFTYNTSDGVYFDTSKLDNYGELAGQKVEDKEAGTRVEVNKEKKNTTDFALWKFSPEGKKRQMEWESPWGIGFPGWHIECTAMSVKYLGSLYDIHTGGMDLKMVHHPNEIAQSEGALGTTEARFWMHGEFLQVDGGKMSKSLGNAYSIDDIIAKSIDPLAFRYLTLTAHYRSHLNFTWDSLEAAQSALKKLRMIVREWDTPAIGCVEYEKRFAEAINDDLDSPQAIAIVWELVHDATQLTSAKAQSLLKFESVLGLGLLDFISRELIVPEKVQKLVDQRAIARDTKDWEEGDRLRDEAKKLGFVIEDTPDGQRVTEE
ncbi:MAG TPA: cysteine--tRNA ligase [Patescibacteria group bacterium]|nr:cysteine--tRNA ligase [Patescibacteria group bacterium]